MAESYQLNAKFRDQVGKSISRDLRNEGRIPAILYGNEKDNVNISLENKEITKLYNTGRIMATLLNIDIDGKPHQAITRDLQFDPVMDTILHADFLYLDKGSKITIEVPAKFLNDDICPGLKMGGVLNIVRFSVELVCPIETIPESITFDLSTTEIGTSIHISDFVLPDGVTPAITDRDFTVATVVAPASQSDESEEEAASEAEDNEQGNAAE